MKKIALALVCFFGIAVFVQADDTSDYQKFMRSAVKQVGILRKASTGPEAADAAKTLAADFGDMQAFWQKKGAADAAGLAEKGKTAAGDLEEAAKANDADKASASMKTITSTCGACHMAHRAGDRKSGYTVKE